MFRIYRFKTFKIGSILLLFMIDFFVKFSHTKLTRILHGYFVRYLEIFA